MFVNEEKEVADEGFPSFALSVYQRYRDELRRYLARRIPHSQDVDDVAQEVYLRLLRVDPRRNLEEPLKYLYVVASHALADHMEAKRRDSKRYLFFAEVPEDSANLTAISPPKQPEDITATDQAVMHALSKLPDMHAAVLYLFERDGLSRAEIAARCRISEDTVKTYLTQARRMLRSMVWPARDLPR